MSATSSACETPTAWEVPSISTTSRAPARSAMKRCAVTGMFLSSSPNTNHEGIDFQRRRPRGLVCRDVSQRPLAHGHEGGLLGGDVFRELLVVLLLADKATIMAVAVSAPSRLPDAW
jgi:hypothetical protein